MLKQKCIVHVNYQDFVYIYTENKTIYTIRKHLRGKYKSKVYH